MLYADCPHGFESPFIYQRQSSENSSQLVRNLVLFPFPYPSPVSVVGCAENGSGGMAVTPLTKCYCEYAKKGHANIKTKTKTKMTENAPHQPLPCAPFLVRLSQSTPPSRLHHAEPVLLSCSVCLFLILPFSLSMSFALFSRFCHDESSSHGFFLSLWVETRVHFLARGGRERGSGRRLRGLIVQELLLLVMKGFTTIFKLCI